MKKKEKMVILVLLIITIILVAVGVLTKTNSNKNQTAKTNENDNNSSQTSKEEKLPVAVLDDGTKVNISEKLHEDKEIDGIVISNIQLTENGNLTQLLATIKNKSDGAKGGYRVKIIAYDKDGLEITSMDGYLGNLESGATGTLQAEGTSVAGLVNANNIKIEKR